MAFVNNSFKSLIIAAFRFKETSIYDLCATRYLYSFKLIVAVMKNCVSNKTSDILSLNRLSLVSKFVVINLYKS